MQVFSVMKMTLFVAKLDACIIRFQTVAVGTRHLGVVRRLHEKRLYVADAL